MGILDVMAVGGINNGIGGAVNGGGLANSTTITASGLLSTVMQWLTWIVGGVSVIFIIIGGLRYITSGGDAEKVKKAKNTLLYACIGLGVAVLAGVITLFISQTLLQGGSPQGPS